MQTLGYREFIQQIEPVDEHAMIQEETMYGDVSGINDTTQYKSANTEVLGWVAEVVSGKSLTKLVAENVEGAGLELGLHCSCDQDMVPLLNGGGFMTARDLARHGLLLARHGLGVYGERCGGDGSLIRDSLQGGGTRLVRPGLREGSRYSNHLMVTPLDKGSSAFGHGGFGGSYLMVDPATCTAVVFFSVLETVDAFDNTAGGSYASEI